jgi:hypothetical protein
MMGSTRFMLPLVSALALAAPAVADSSAPALNDATEPGSVIVFPKFVRGTQNVDGYLLPSTEIEVGVVCPIGQTCAEHQAIKIRFQWVCPSWESDIAHSFICKSNNFDVIGSVSDKIVFDTENLTITGSNSVSVAVPPCPMGYLIGWVINPSNDQPVAYDALVGDGVVRESGTAVATYNAIPIQSVSGTTSGDPTKTAFITTVSAGGGLPPKLAFDGQANHYKAVTGVVIGDVKFDNPNPSSLYPIASTSYLTLLTLDVATDFPNNPTEVDLDFWSEGEKLLSTSTEFICWTETPLTWIDPNLTQSQMGSRKGVFRSFPANKFPFAGTGDRTGPVTMLGLVETMENGNARAYFSGLQNDSKPVPTYFLPE